MPACKKCLYYEACRMNIHHKTNYERYEEKYKKKIDSSNCSLFKDRSKFIELPDVGEYMSVTTLDEAIDHCFSIVNSTDENICAECKAEHLKLCGWLGELKRRKDAERAIKQKSDD